MTSNISWAEALNDLPKNVVMQMFAVDISSCPWCKKIEAIHLFVNISDENAEFCKQNVFKAHAGENGSDLWLINEKPLH